MSKPADRVHRTPRRSASKIRPAKTSKKETAAKGATAVRDALPFFKKGRGKIPTSWWNVTPSGNYSADLETGMAYASAFLPMMKYNAGASSLGAIVSDMAKAGRNPEKKSQGLARYRQYRPWFHHGDRRNPAIRHGWNSHSCRCDRNARRRPRRRVRQVG